MSLPLVNAVYYPNWCVYTGRPPSCFDWELSSVSHVFYAFVNLDGRDGSLHFSDKWADCDKPMDDIGTRGCLSAWRQMRDKNHPHLKILLSIGGGTCKTFPAVVSDETKIQKFTASARQMLDSYGLDGIDIDWEHPSTPTEGRQFLNLLTALRSALPSPTYVLTTALPAGSWALQHIRLSRVSQQVDFINLMAYDFVGPAFPFPSGKPLSGHHAQLYPPRTPPNHESQLSCASSIKYLLKQHGVPPHKIVLGIPLYARSFLGAKGRHQPFGQGPPGSQDRTFEYRQLPIDGTQEVYDEDLGAAYCVSEECGFVSYDNEASVTAKAAFVRKNGLAGLFYWHIGQDRCGGEGLAAVGYRALKRYGVLSGG